MVPEEFNPNITHPAYLIRKFLYKSILELAPILKGKLLDFGCGLKPYENLFTVEEYIGIDYYGEGETYPKDKVDIIYDGKTIPFKNDYFDSVFSSEVFEHIFNPDVVIKELYRILKPNGMIPITCPFTFPEHEIPNDYCRYSSYGIKHLFEKNGFILYKYRKTGNSILAVAQLKSIYWNNYILSTFKNIPILRSIIRKTFFLFHHSYSLIKSKLLPESKDLFLSNILILQKK